MPHIANHLTAIWSVDAHMTVMRTLRHIYRAELVQPLLVVLFIFQIASGLFLWRERMTVQADLFGTLQTAAGIYLASYLGFGSQRVRMGRGRSWRRHRRHNHCVDVSAAHSVITSGQVAKSGRGPSWTFETLVELSHDPRKIGPLSWRR
jgi:hypothetical protein